MPLPTPHLDKITAALRNDKVPVAAKERLQDGIENYNKWVLHINIQPDHLITLKPIT